MCVVFLSCASKNEAGKNDPIYRAAVIDRFVDDQNLMEEVLGFNKKIIAAKYVQKLMVGRVAVNMAEIDKCRQVSKASSSPHSPWVKWFDQMAKKTVIHRIAKRLPKNDAISSVVRIDEDTDFKQAVNVTPTPDKQEQPLSRLKEAMGMPTEEADQAADNVINNYRKEE